MEQVIDAVRFDIHMERDVSGHRYIERISEIVSKPSEDMYEVRDVIRYDGTKYVVADGFSSGIVKEISKYLSEEEARYLYENYCV